MNQKSIFVLIAIAVLGCCFLAGCGGDDEHELELTATSAPYSQNTVPSSEPDAANQDQETGEAVVEWEDDQGTVSVPDGPSAGVSGSGTGAVQEQPAVGSQTEITQPVTPSVESTDPTANPITQPTQPSPAVDPITQPTQPSSAADPTTQPTQPLPNTGATEPAEPQEKPLTEYTYDEYMAMSSAQQQAFFEKFDSIDAFYEWYDAAKRDYDAQREIIEVGGDGGGIDLGEIIGGSN